ncbi:MAG: CehA/McbA family metallohydrolase, partial [Halobacteria archaeon]
MGVAAAVLVAIFFAAAPASAGIWADGQLHTHSTECGHDGVPETPDGSVEKMINRARAKGLEFLAITDNNPLCPPTRVGSANMNNFALLPSVESYPGKGVAIVGRDAGESKGHMNAFRVSSHINSVWNLTSAADAAAVYHNEGGIVQVNHPYSTLQPFTDLSWYLGYDFDFQTMEIINVNWHIPPGSGKKSFDKWRELLAQGRKITGVAVSDYHMDKQWLGFLHNLDAPYTSVYVDNVSTDGVVAGLKAGRAYTIRDANTSRAVLEADANNDGIFEALIGDTVSVPYGEKVKFKVTVTGTSKYDDLEVWDRTGKIIDTDIKAGTYTYTFDAIATVDNFYLVKVEAPWWLAYEAQSITNPIWVKVDGAGATEVSPSSQTVFTGSVASGSFSSLLEDDGSYEQLDQTNIGSVVWPEYELDARWTFDLQASNISRIDIKTDAWKDDDSPQIQRFNYTTNAWEFAGNVRDSTSDPGLYTVPVCAGGKCSHYVSGGQAQVRLRYDSGAPSNNDWVRIDYLALAMQSTPSWNDPIPVQVTAKASVLERPAADLVAGNLASTYARDGNILQLDQAGLDNDMDARFTFTLNLASGSTVNKLRLDTDAWSWDDTTALQVYNWDTGGWAGVSNLVTQSGQPGKYLLALCSTSASCDPYVNGANQVKVRYYHDSFLGDNDWVKTDYAQLIAEVTLP